MAINASGLPSLFSASTWITGGGFDHNGQKLLASIDGAWVETVDPDGVRISEPDFDAIAAAGVDGPYVVIDGEPKAVVARTIGGQRWIFFADPE